MTNNHSYQHHPFIHQEEEGAALLGVLNSEDDEMDRSSWTRKAGVMVAVTMFVVLGMTMGGSNPDGTFVSIRPFDLWGRGHHKKSKHRGKHFHHNHKKDKEPEPQVDCDAILVGVFEKYCISDSGLSEGTLAAVKTVNGMMGLAASEDGDLSALSMGELDPEVPTPSSNCERHHSYSRAPDWEPVDGTVSYNVEEKYGGAIMWATDVNTFCILTQLDGRDCKDTLHDLKKDFKHVNETDVDLDAFSSRDLC